jgi:hypothetical protein
MALLDDPRLHRILHLYTGRVELLNMVPVIGGSVTLTGDAARYFVTLEREIMQLSASLMREQIKSSDLEG